jgi:hypothetical protein
MRPMAVVNVSGEFFVGTFCKAGASIYTAASVEREICDLPNMKHKVP